MHAEFLAVFALPQFFQRERVLDSSGFILAAIIGFFKAVQIINIQVFFNLIMNAMQAVTDGEGEISIRIYKKRHEICVDIDDNGPGVSSDKRDEILEPFVSNREGGMGLGLSIVVEILRSHGGYLQISQSEQQGARFTVCLPAANQ